MADRKAIQLKSAATKLGIPLAEYLAHHNKGEKWCSGCKQWHVPDRFNRELGRWDGLQAVCREFQRLHRVPRKHDNYRDRARNAVNYAVKIGCFADPDRVPCSDCGHIGPGRRHDYDHIEGYAPAKHLRVQVVCQLCHAAREVERRARRRRKATAYAKNPGRKLNRQANLERMKRVA